MESIDNVLKQIKHIGGETRPICPHCGKPFIDIPRPEIDKNLAKMRPDCLHFQWIPNCTCLRDLQEKGDQRIKEEQQRREEELKRQEEQRQIRLEEEKKEAEKRRIEQIFNNSMMTPFFRKKKFENLEMTDNLKFCKEYADNFNKETSQGLQFIGAIGTGKTTALACICNQLMEREHPCLFTTFSALLNKFSNYSYEHAGDILPLLEDLTKFEFVVLDDLGRETYTDKRKEFAFMIIDHLMNYEVVTAITANPNIISKLAKLEEWQAIFDRLREICPNEKQFSCKSMRGANG